MWLDSGSLAADTYPAVGHAGGAPVHALVVGGAHEQMAPADGPAGAIAGGEPLAPVNVEAGAAAAPFNAEGVPVTGAPAQAGGWSVAVGPDQI